jgi:probable F420-dependent oxidoreductase
MKFGFIPIEGGHFYQEFRQEVLLGESLGFDSVWLEEHHGISNHYWPSPLVGLAGIAAMTEQILLGTDIMVMPFYHPVRVAEDTAMVDIMSNGRFILGTAIGYRPDEFALYRASMDKRGARFEEAICLIKQLWTQEQVHFDGTFYQVKNLKIEPRPLAKPHPPIWIGGWGKLSLARAARLGDAWIPGPTANLDKLRKAQSIYRQNLKSIDVDPETKPTPLTREVVIAGRDEEAWEIAERHLLISYRNEYGSKEWDHPLIGGEDTTPVEQLYGLSRDRFLIGSPERINLQLQKFKEAFGVDHLICRLYFPGISHAFIMSELKLLASEVLPVFKN